MPIWKEGLPFKLADSRKPGKTYAPGGRFKPAGIQQPDELPPWEQFVAGTEDNPPVASWKPELSDIDNPALAQERGYGWIWDQPEARSFGARTNALGLDIIQTRTLVDKIYKGQYFTERAGQTVSIFNPTGGLGSPQNITFSQVQEEALRRFGQPVLTTSETTGERESVVSPWDFMHLSEPARLGVTSGVAMPYTNAESIENFRKQYGQEPLRVGAMLYPQNYAGGIAPGYEVDEYGNILTGTGEKPKSVGKRMKQAQKKDPLYFGGTGLETRQLGIDPQVGIAPVANIVPAMVVLGEGFFPSGQAQYDPNVLGSPTRLRPFSITLPREFSENWKPTIQEGEWINTPGGRFSVAEGVEAQLSTANRIRIPKGGIGIEEITKTIGGKQVIDRVLRGTAEVEYPDWATSAKGWSGDKFGLAVELGMSEQRQITYGGRRVDVGILMGTNEPAQFAYAVAGTWDRATREQVLGKDAGRWAPGSTKKVWEHLFSSGQIQQSTFLERVYYGPAGGEEIDPQLDALMKRGAAEIVGPIEERDGSRFTTARMTAMAYAGPVGMLGTMAYPTHETNISGETLRMIETQDPDRAAAIRAYSERRRATSANIAGAWQAMRDPESNYSVARGTDMLQDWDQIVAEAQDLAKEAVPFELKEGVEEFGLSANILRKMSKSSGGKGIAFDLGELGLGEGMLVTPDPEAILRLYGSSTKVRGQMFGLPENMVKMFNAIKRYTGDRENPEAREEALNTIRKYGLQMSEVTSSVATRRNTDMYTGPMEGGAIQSAMALAPAEVFMPQPRLAHMLRQVMGNKDFGNRDLFKKYNNDPDALARAMLSGEEQMLGDVVFLRNPVKSSEETNIRGRLLTLKQLNERMGTNYTLEEAERLGILAGRQLAEVTQGDWDVDQLNIEPALEGDNSDIELLNTQLLARAKTALGGELQSTLKKVGQIPRTEEEAQAFIESALVAVSGKETALATQAFEEGKGDMGMVYNKGLRTWPARVEIGMPERPVSKEMRPYAQDLADRVRSQIGAPLYSKAQDVEDLPASGRQLIKLSSWSKVLGKYWDPGLNSYQPLLGSPINKSVSELIQLRKDFAKEGTTIEGDVLASLFASPEDKGFSKLAGMFESKRTGSGTIVKQLQTMARERGATDIDRDIVEQSPLLRETYASAYYRDVREGRTKAENLQPWEEKLRQEGQLQGRFNALWSKGTPEQADLTEFIGITKEMLKRRMMTEQQSLDVIDYLKAMGNWGEAQPGTPEVINEEGLNQLASMPMSQFRREGKPVETTLEAAAQQVGPQPQQGPSSTPEEPRPIGLVTLQGRGDEQELEIKRAQRQREANRAASVELSQGDERDAIIARIQKEHGSLGVQEFLEWEERHPGQQYTFATKPGEISGRWEDLPTAEPVGPQPQATAGGARQLRARTVNADPKFAGWKLHLGFSKENEEAVDAYLGGLKGKGVFSGYKLGSSSGQEGKDATVYVGGRGAAESLANRISQDIGGVLSPISGETLKDDIELAPKVGGRFDVGRAESARIERERGIEFHQYGRGGVPFSVDYLRFVRGEVSGPEGTSQEDFGKFLLERDRKVLEQEYGEFFTGAGGGDGGGAPPATAASTDGEPPDPFGPIRKILYGTETPENEDQLFAGLVKTSHEYRRFKNPIGTRDPIRGAYEAAGTIGGEELQAQFVEYTTGKHLGSHIGEKGKRFFELGEFVRGEPTRAEKAKLAAEAAVPTAPEPKTTDAVNPAEDKNVLAGGFDLKGLMETKTLEEAIDWIESQDKMFLEFKEGDKAGARYYTETGEIGINPEVIVERFMNRGAEQGTLKGVNIPALGIESALDAVKGAVIHEATHDLQKREGRRLRKGDPELEVDASATVVEGLYGKKRLAEWVQKFADINDPATFNRLRGALGLEPATQAAAGAPPSGKPPVPPSTATPESEWEGEALGGAEEKTPGAGPAQPAGETRFSDMYQARVQMGSLQRRYERLMQYGRYLDPVYGSDAAAKSPTEGLIQRAVVAAGGDLASLDVDPDLLADYKEIIDQVKSKSDPQSPEQLKRATAVKGLLSKTQQVSSRIGTFRYAQKETDEQVNLLVSAMKGVVPDSEIEAFKAEVDKVRAQTPPEITQGGATVDSILGALKISPKELPGMIHSLGAFGERGKALGISGGATVGSPEDQLAAITQELVDTRRLLVGQHGKMAKAELDYIEATSLETATKKGATVMRQVSETSGGVGLIGLMGTPQYQAFAAATGGGGGGGGGPKMQDFGLGIEFPVDDQGRPATLGGATFALARKFASPFSTERAMIARAMEYSGANQVFQEYIPAAVQRDRAISSVAIGVGGYAPWTSGIGYEMAERQAGIANAKTQAGQIAYQAYGFGPTMPEWARTAQAIGSPALGYGVAAGFGAYFLGSAVSGVSSAAATTAALSSALGVTPATTGIGAAGGALASMAIPIALVAGAGIAAYGVENYATSQMSDEAQAAAAAARRGERMVQGVRSAYDTTKPMGQRVSDIFTGATSAAEQGLITIMGRGPEGPEPIWERIQRAGGLMTSGMAMRQQPLSTMSVDRRSVELQRIAEDLSKQEGFTAYELPDIVKALGQVSYFAPDKGGTGEDLKRYSDMAKYMLDTGVTPSQYAPFAQALGARRPGDTAQIFDFFRQANMAPERQTAVMQTMQDWSFLKTAGGTWQTMAGMAARYGQLSEQGASSLQQIMGGNQVFTTQIMEGRYESGLSPALERLVLPEISPLEPGTYMRKGTSTNLGDAIRSIRPQNLDLLNVRGRNLGSALLAATPPQTRSVSSLGAAGIPAIAITPPSISNDAVSAAIKQTYGSDFVQGWDPETGMMGLEQGYQQQMVGYQQEQRQLGIIGFENQYGFVPQTMSRTITADQLGGFYQRSRQLRIESQQLGNVAQMGGTFNGQQFTGAFEFQRQSLENSYASSMGSVGIQRQQMELGREWQLTNREWQVEDMATARLRGRAQLAWQAEDLGAGMNQARIRIGWQMEDVNIARDRGRVRFDYTRQDMATAEGRADTQYGWQLQDFARQEQSFALQRQGTILQREGSMMQRGWAAEDLSRQRGVSQMQFGWQMEDMEENIRFASGRERKVLLKQRERAVTSRNVEEEGMDIQEERAKKTYELEDQRYQLEDKRYALERESMDDQMERLQEQRTWQEEDFDKQKSRFEESVGWQEEDWSRQMSRLEEQAGWQEENFGRQMTRMQEQARWQEEDWAKEEKRFGERTIYEDKVYALQVKQLDHQAGAIAKNHALQIAQLDESITKYKEEWIQLQKNMELQDDIDAAQAISQAAQLTVAEKMANTSDDWNALSTTLGLIPALDDTLALSKANELMNSIVYAQQINAFKEAREFLGGVGNLARLLRDLGF